jgi:hypothetical protein
MEALSPLGPVAELGARKGFTLLVRLTVVIAEGTA